MYASSIKIAIILSWLSLISFWCIKIFGANWFDIMVNNDNFIKFSALVQTTWLKYLVSFITVFIANYFILCAISQTFCFTKIKLLIAILAITSIWAISNFVPITFGYLPFWYAYFVMIVWGFFNQTGYKKLFGFVSIISEFLFSSASMITRNISLSIVPEYLFAYILSIDVYIMIILYYLYSNLIRIEKRGK